MYLCIYIAPSACLNDVIVLMTVVVMVVVYRPLPAAEARRVPLYRTSSELCSLPLDSPQKHSTTASVDCDNSNNNDNIISVKRHPL